MNSKILNSIANVIEYKEENKKRTENGKVILQELINCVKNCQDRFGGKSELATEDDLRIIQLCDKWEKVLSHGIRTNLSNSALQNLVAAGLNFTFNIINTGNSLWSYACLHLTKHEKERFKILANINTPLGYFRAFLRASLNERSLERYLHGWITHGLLMEYYEEGSLVREPESSSLPNIAAGLSSILFALTIDKPELNETQQSNNVNKTELVIPLPTPVKSSANLKKKPLRQVISFDKNDQTNVREATIDKRKSVQPVNLADDSSWNSAPATCLNSPDAKSFPQAASSSEPNTSEYKSIRHFFPDGMKSIDSPSQILTKLSECAKEMFSSSNSVYANHVVRDDDVSDLSVNNLKISESDSDEVAGSIDGSTSCLELCFNEDDSISESAKSVINSALEIREREFLALQMKCNQLEIGNKMKINNLESKIAELNNDNDRLKEQLKQYMSAVEMGKALKSGHGDNDEVSEYEKKLVQVAEMHAELMEFNQYLQNRIRDLEGISGLEILDCPNSNVKVYIPTAFLVGKKTHSYHVYQIFLKIGLEEWNVFHRYAKFYELHKQLRKCHPDLANYKFPPKKTIGKRNEQLVEQRRLALQAYLRHVVFVLPELRDCTNRAHLITLLPFFGSSSTSNDHGFNHLSNHQRTGESASTFDAL